MTLYAKQQMCGVARTRNGASNNRKERIAFVTLVTASRHCARQSGLPYGRIWDHELVATVMTIAGNGTGDTR